MKRFFKYSILTGVGFIILFSLIFGGYQLGLKTVDTPQFARSVIGSEIQIPILKIAHVSAATTADYSIDGTADDVQFQAALDALPATGGIIQVMSSGNITFTNTVSRIINDVTIIGTGQGTLFNYDGSHALFTVGAQTGWSFRDLSTDDGGITNYNKAYLENVKLGATTYASRPPDGQNFVGNLTGWASNATLATSAVSATNQSGGTVNATQIKDDDLTSGRVVISTTDGQLTDDPDLSFSGDTLTATNAIDSNLAYTSSDWLSGYTYRKQIVANHPSGVLTNYQIKILVGERTGSGTYNVDCDAKCQSDFDDIRFTNSDCTTLLSYWIESITGTTPNQVATIWVKFDSIGTTDTTFYMYYGNSAATSVSSGSDTFIFYDDAERGVDTDPVGGSWTIASGSVTISTDHAYSPTRSIKFAGGGATFATTSLVAADDSYSIRIRVYREDVTSGIGTHYIGHGNGTYRARVFIAGNGMVYYTNTAGTTVHTGYFVSHDDWFLVELKDINFTSKTFTIYINDSKVAEATMSTSATDTNLLRLGNDNPTATDNSYCDNIIITKADSAEPVLSNWGSEQIIYSSSEYIVGSDPTGLLIKNELKFDNITNTLILDHFSGDGSKLTNLNIELPGISIAAPDSSLADKTRATYVCSGATHETTFNILYDGLPATGAALTVYPGNYYFSDSFLIDRSIPFVINADGANFHPTATGVTCIKYNIDWTGYPVLQQINGATFTDGRFFTGTNAIGIYSTFAVNVNRCNINNFGTGILLDPYNYGAESTVIKDCWISSQVCIDMISTGTGSSLMQTKIKDCYFLLPDGYVGIDTTKGTTVLDLNRSELTGLTFWEADNNTALKLDCILGIFSRIQLQIEGSDSASTGRIGIDYGTNFTGSGTVEFSSIRLDTPVNNPYSKNTLISHAADINLSTMPLDRNYLHQDWSGTNGWTEVETSTGAVTVSPLNLTMATGATSSSVAAYKSGTLIGTSYMQRNQEQWWISLESLTALTASTVNLYLADTGADSPPAATSKHVGWKIIDGEIWATVANGTNETAVDTGITIATISTYANLLIRYSLWNSTIEFWINGQLEASITTNFPADSTKMIYLGITNSSATDQSVVIISTNYISGAITTIGS